MAFKSSFKANVILLQHALKLRHKLLVGVVAEAYGIRKAAGNTGAATLAQSLVHPAYLLFFIIVYRQIGA
jgi:hypothetical protein